jgi:hypothetical protein
MKMSSNKLHMVISTTWSCMWCHKQCNIKENKLSSNWQQSWWTKLKIMTLQSTFVLITTIQFGDQHHTYWILIEWIYFKFYGIVQIESQLSWNVDIYAC